MIVVVGRVATDADKREDLLRVAQAVAVASRAEQGCINYRCYEDIEVENDFVFVEEWESQEALQRHFATPHVADFMRSIVGVIVGPPDVKFHEIASSMDLQQVTAGG